jgi:hypothetical protein
MDGAIGTLLDDWYVHRYAVVFDGGRRGIKGAEISNIARQINDGLGGLNEKQEDDTTGFLGVMLKQDPETGLLEMKQTGLIKRFIKALGLDDGAKGNYLKQTSD